MKRTTILLTLLIIFLLSTSSALAMSSANYKLDWFVPLTGGGGGPAASANYAVNFTVGQSAIGASASTNYGVGLGYWYGVMIRNIFLPLIMR
jgi:hypothetical protein